MATPNLEVQLTADIKQLEKQLKIAKKKLKEIPNAIPSKSDPFKPVGKSAANAMPAVQEFSRVIQDAPYGIQGVGNNIQQLTANFGHLSKSAGGTIPALKLMFSSLAGPAGILLAVSVVTSAWTYFGDELFKGKDKIKEATNEQDKLTEALNKYKDSLRGVESARLKGNQSAAKDLVSLRLLRNQIDDTTLSQEQRKDAVKKLQKAFPAYFKNIKEEAILNGQVSATYNTLTTSILKRSRATAAGNILVKNLEEEFNLTQQLEAANKKYSKQLEATKKLEGLTPGVITGYDTSSKLSSKIALSAAKANDLYKEQEKIITRIGVLQGENAKLEAQAIDNIVVVPGGGKGGTPILDKPLAVKAGLVIEPIGAFALGIVPESAVNVLQTRTNAITEELAKIKLALANFNSEASHIIKDNITGTFAGIGVAIGTALEEGGNLAERLSQALLGGIGGMLVQLGELAIATGVGMIAIKLAFDSLGGAGAIAAGIALVALGSVFSSKAKKIGSQGGVGGQGSSGGGGSFSSSPSFTNSNGGFDSGRVVFEISGQKLIGVLNNTQQANIKLGGNVN